MSKTIIICLKQGRKANDFEICSANDSENFRKLLDMCEKSGKEERIEFQNVKGETIVIEGSMKGGFRWYKANEPDRVRLLVMVKVPEHKGLPERGAPSKSKVKARRSRSRLRSRRRR